MRKSIHLFSDCVASVVLLATLCLVAAGCGPSQQELMMRSAQRSRGDEDDEPPPAAKVAESKPVTELTDSPIANDPEPIAKADPAEEPVEEDAETDAEMEALDEQLAAELIPIEQRQPDQPLSGEDRRRRAYQNLKRVSKALLAYVDDNGRLPPTYFEANGFKTVSWRVEILPYLGYDHLYEKFDKNVPWNRPPNDELLKFIPDEFVSPERFDTSTNIVMPSKRGMIGGEGGRIRPIDVEDGLGSTLLVVEVNDDHQTEWSAPNDFAPTSRTAARAGMIGLREDGGFAVWANGWPVLLANELSERVFWDVLTIEAGDGLQAGKVHRDIPLKNVSEASVAAEPEPTDLPTEPTAQPMPESGPTPEAVTAVREDVPLAGELAEVQGRFRGLFAEKLSEAKTDDEKRELAEELLETAAGLSADPVGAYALQTAAMRVAIEGGGVGELVGAIDQRVGQFEVDAYRENRDWMLAFGRGVVSKDAESIDGADYAKRAVKVIYAAIHDDDYLAAASLARYSNRLLDQKRDEAIPKLLNRLRGLLGSAKREFDKASDSLAAYRIDPSDGEAAAAVGRFMCFIKGDWQRGLPLLTRGGPESLREMAKFDIRGAADAINQVAIGDAWWDLSEKARTGVYRQSARDRAVFWYEQAFPSMSDSLDRLHVKTRLDEAREAPPSGPLAVVKELAEELQVDLRVGLAAVAEVGQAGGANPYSQSAVTDGQDSDG
jgi:hypothetical protein